MSSRDDSAGKAGTSAAANAAAADGLGAGNRKPAAKAPDESLATVLPAGAAIRVFLAFAAGYFMSYALRSVNAMIAPALIDEFGLSNAQLGSLSAAYFFAFAAVQLPLGIWLDRYGSRRVDAALLLVAAAGCAVFATAGGTLALWIGRALVGAGVAGALMCSLRAFRFWYVAERQQQLAAWMLVAGTLGALSTTVPVQLALPLLGWRGLFWVGALLLVASSASIFFLLPAEPVHRPDAESPWAGYLTVFREPYFWRFGIVTLVIQSSFVAFQSLWLGPWFRQVLGMNLEQSGQALFVFNAALMFSYLALGWAVPALARAGWSTLSLVKVGGAVVVALELWIVFASGAQAWLLWIGVAIFTTVMTLMQTHVSLVFPERLTGRAFTAYNLLTFVGIFLVQWLFGIAVDAMGGTADGGQGFRRALLLWVVLQAASVLVMAFWRVKPPQREV